MVVRSSGLFRVGPQEDVFARLDQDPRFGFVARRDQVDGEECKPAASSVSPTISRFLRQSDRPSTPRSSSSTACATPDRLVNGTLACMTELQTDAHHARLSGRDYKALRLMRG